MVFGRMGGHRGNDTFTTTEINGGRHMQTPEDSDKTRGEFELTRRKFILIAGTATVAATAFPNLSKAQATAPTNVPMTPLTKISFTVNGQLRELEVDTRTTLLDALRE